MHQIASSGHYHVSPREVRGWPIDEITVALRFVEYHCKWTKTQNDQFIENVSGK